MPIAYPSADRVRELFSYVQGTGALMWAPGTKNAGKRAGCLSKARKHRYVRADGVLYLEHRIIWLHAHGALPPAEIDHVNGVKDDNRLCNLREVSREKNMQNIRAATVTNKTGLLGVSPRCDGKKWLARIVVSGKTHYLGSHDTPELAHAAYLAAKRRLHEGCTI